MKQSMQTSPAPWWKFGFVWMVFGGPAVVVVASLVTVYIAVTSSPNELVTEENFRKGVEVNASLSDAENAASLAPAIQARNHAQTGVKPMSANLVPKP
jgi:hypothetical protein